MAYRQGRFDGLCGVYAIINSIHLMTGLSEDACGEIFRKCCRHLDEEDALFPAVRGDGLYFRALGRAFDVAAQEAKRCTKVELWRNDVPRSGSPGLDQFWRKLGRHVSAHGPGSAIVGMSGDYDHWTCISSISRRRLNVADSWGLRHLDRSRCTTGYYRKDRQYVLWPTQTYLLSSSVGPSSP